MSTEHTWSTSGAWYSCHTGSSSDGPSSHARLSTSAAPSANASPYLVHDERQLSESLALAITKEMKQMPHPETLGASAFRGSDVSTFIEESECHSSCHGTDVVAEDIFATFLYYYS